MTARAVITAIALSALLPGCDYSGVSLDEKCSWNCGPYPEVVARVLDTDGQPVPGIRVTGTGRPGSYPVTRATNLDGFVYLSVTLDTCYSPETHPKLLGLRWLWLTCPGCEPTVGSCLGRQVATVMYGG